MVFYFSDCLNLRSDKIQNMLSRVIYIISYLSLKKNSDCFSDSSKSVSYNHLNDLIND